MSHIFRGTPFLPREQQLQTTPAGILFSLRPSEETNGRASNKRSAIQTTNSRINIPGGSLVSDDDVLGILGKFLAPNQEIPTLSDIRRREGSRLPAGISSQHHQEGTGGLAVELILTSEEAEQQCNTPISTIHPVEVSEEAPLMIEDVEPVDILSPDYGMDITLGMFKDISKICRQRGQLSCL
ncbi:hypothetical protein HAX54_006676 [Datura stramonium]|uniref:Uncharacterized protein n=1 Tax=Datura stramonium TaxID=4076 RepID=A0ABS8TC34_DATST|nr:hypothetical protein [Datura stramonium]